MLCRTFLLALGVMFSVSATAKPSVTSINTSQLSASINSAIQQIAPFAKVGITIKSMKYGDILYNRNDRSFFVPASTSKVLTAEAALLFLGPNFKFATRFVNTGLLQGPQLNGNLYLVNSGDPTLTYYDLAELTMKLKARGVQQIHGNLYIDNTAYDNDTTGPGWLDKDRKYCYGAPISASIINHNCLSFSVHPGSSSGMPARIITDPRAYYARINNAVVTTSKTSHTCYVKMDQRGGSGYIAISGCLGKNQQTGGTSVISDSFQYQKAMMQELLIRFGIRLDGEILPGKVSSGFTELARHESKPLRLMIADMLKMSDNVIAGSLFKKIGEVYSKRPGSWNRGSLAVARILQAQAAVDVWHLSLIDGSGLSRYNQITPAQLLRVLEFTFHNTTTNYPFISSLPIAGVDGTLKRRLKNIAWKVRAKTGTMQGVVSLAGYAMTQDKEPVAFVIMINGKNGSVWQYRELEDRVVTYITKHSRRLF